MTIELGDIVKSVFNAIGCSPDTGIINTYYFDNTYKGIRFLSGIDQGLSNTTKLYKQVDSFIKPLTDIFRE